jgi:hypothetical protein
MVVAAVDRRNLVGLQFPQTRPKTKVALGLKVPATESAKGLGQVDGNPRFPRFCQPANCESPPFSRVFREFVAGQVDAQSDSLSTTAKCKAAGELGTTVRQILPKWLSTRRCARRIELNDEGEIMDAE